MDKVFDPFFTTKHDGTGLGLAVCHSIIQRHEGEIDLKSAPGDPVVGDYEVRVKTESHSYNRAIPTEDKLYRISIKTRPNVWATTGLFAGLLIILAGVAVFLVRLTRR